MICALTCFMFLLTGGNPVNCVSPDIPDYQLMSNQSFKDMPVGNATKNETSQLFNLTSNQTSNDKAANCSYQDVLNFIGLNKNNETFSMSRPVKDHKNKTYIYLEMVVYAILDVKESDQTFIAYVWIYMLWGNDYSAWNKEDFCGISDIVVPTEVLWKPDLTIEEMIEKDKAPPSPFIKIHHNKLIELRNDQIVISACKMYVYKFPFDIQSCNITFKSYLYSENEIEIRYPKDSELTKWSKEIMTTEFEWVFVNMSVSNDTVDFYDYNQTRVIYAIQMKRKSVLHVASFVLPVLFFLCLDFFSLLMPHGGGDKTGFKITVLLAVTVMQLVLVEILPFTSTKIPLLVIYINGIFGLMLLSLLETILVNYLIGKDSASQDSETDDAQSLNEKLDIKCCHCSSRFDEMGDQFQPTVKQGSCDLLTEVFLAVEKVSDEVQRMKKSVTFLCKKTEEQKPGYWATTAKKIDTFFSFLYITTVLVFLFVIFTVWLS